MNARHAAVVLFLIALSVLPGLADDGVTLHVAKGPGPGEVTLDWSDGTSPYRVYRSQSASAVAATPNLLGETASTSWNDIPPPGEVFFYRVRSVPAAFRITDLDLMDPHAFFLFIIFCTDITNTELNPLLQDQITLDSDLDGLLDLSAILLFRPLDQAAAGGNGDVGFGDCTAPIESTVCDVNPETPPEAMTYSNLTLGSCLAPYAGTTSGYSPPVVSPVAPPTCFVSDLTSFSLTLANATLPLQDVQASANYVGDPADSLINGLMRGFLSEAAADATIIDFGIGGPQPLSSLLPGGQGNCSSGDDRDLGLDGSTLGWWFYWNFSAVAVDYAGP